MERVGKVLYQCNYITCMKSMNKNREENKAISFLLWCNENSELIVMEASGIKVKTTIKLPSVGVFIEVHGQYDVDGKVFIACRDGKVYIVKGGAVTNQVYDIESKPVGMVYIEKSIVVAGMNSVISSYYGKGKKNYSIYMPCTISAIEKMVMKRTKAVNAVLVALSNGEIRMYNDKFLITTIKCDDVILGFRFGVFGREDGSLVINFKHGGLSAKILQRQANLETSTHKAGPSLKQDIPLKIKLFTELTQRERDQWVEMHRLFQKDLWKLRLKTAQSYISLLNEGHAPMSYAQGSKLRLNATTEGIGPIFKIKLEIQNLSKKTMVGTRVMLSYDNEIYKVLSNGYHKQLTLLPSITYKQEIMVENIDENGAADLIRVFVYNDKSSVPLITANLNMPLSEVDLE